MQAGTYGELLVQERARNRKLEGQLAARQDATAGGSPQRYFQPVRFYPARDTWPDAGAGR